MTGVIHSLRPNIISLWCPGRPGLRRTKLLESPSMQLLPPNSEFQLEWPAWSALWGPSSLLPLMYWPRPFCKLLKPSSARSKPEGLDVYQEKRKHCLINRHLASCRVMAGHEMWSLSKWSAGRSPGSRTNGLPSIYKQPWGMSSSVYIGKGPSFIFIHHTCF